MRVGIAAAAFVAAFVAATIAGCGGGGAAKRSEPAPGEPSVEVISPRNGARQRSRAVVVKVEIRNFRLAPRHFGGEPQLGEGSIRFGLNRVPDCVSPKRLARAQKNPVGRGRLVGPSFDYARYAGPNGVLAERIGSAGGYSPATRPQIYYHDLPVGFYHLNVTLAQNNGAPTPYHGVTNFRILPPPGAPPRSCPSGKVPSAKAAALE
jgi:hypothetical protein